MSAAPIDVAVHHGRLSHELVAEVVTLAERVFETTTIDVAWRLARMPEASVCCARQGGVLVGFKAGYAIAERRYSSWLGAVDPAFRRQGIARRLADLQHAWAREAGFFEVQTSCRSENPAMAQLNLQSGFVVVGTRLEAHGLQVLWSKRLA